jgi:hypothetical protein
MMVSLMMSLMMNLNLMMGECYHHCLHFFGLYFAIKQSPKPIVLQLGLALNSILLSSNKISQLMISLLFFKLYSL